MFIPFQYPFILLSLCASLSYCSYYNSVTSYAELGRKQQTLVKMLENCAEELMTEEDALVQDIKRYINNFRKLIEDGESPGEILIHPINAFHLMKHIILDWKNISKGIQTASTDCLKNLFHYRRMKQYPLEDDLSVIAVSIGRLQHMYKLDSKALVEGWIRISNRSREAFKSKIPMDWKDVRAIGVSMMNRQYTKTAIRWLKATRRLFSAQPSAYKPVSDLLNQANTELGKQKKQHMTDDSLLLSMGRICRFENLKSDSDLVCRYLTRNRGFLIIGPVKLEELSRDPPIMMFHDLLTDKEVELSIRISTPEIKQPETRAEEVSIVKVRQSYWLNRTHEGQVYEKVLHRIEEVTGLNARSDGSSYYSALPFLVANYGIGGAHAFHTDYEQGKTANCNFYSWMKEAGDSIATLMTYLNNVELGGATVFPLANVAVQPKKGSAVFWYSLFKNGTGDLASIHGGCPVLYGNKWISNKRVYMNHQHRYQCGLSNNERHGLL